eukprot:40112-Amphidinium_carterae.1
MEKWLRQRRVHVVYIDPGELTLHWGSKWTTLLPVFPQCFPPQMWRRATHGGFLLGSRTPNVPEVSEKANFEPQAASVAGSHVAGTPSQGDLSTGQAAGAALTVPKVSELQSGFLLSTQLALGYVFMKHGIYLASDDEAGEQVLCNFEVSFVRLLNTHKGTGHRKRSRAAFLQRKSRRQEKRASSMHSEGHLLPLEPAVKGEDDISEGLVDATSSQASASACLEYIESRTIYDTGAALVVVNVFDVINCGMQASCIRCVLEAFMRMSHPASAVLMPPPPRTLGAQHATLS